MSVFSLSMPPRNLRTDTVLQMEAAECGAAALTVVLRHFGRDVELQEVREACAVSRDGVSALSIVRAAKAFGLHGTGLRRPVSQLQDLDAPYIVFWKQNHFLVVEGIGRRTVHLNDPAGGRRRMSLEEFASGYSGVALTFRPVEEYTAPPRPPRRRGSAVIGAMLRTGRAGLVYAVVAGIAVTVPTTAAAMVTAIFVEEVLSARTPGLATSVLLVALAVVVLELALNLLQQRALLRLRSILAARMAAVLLWHLLRLPTRFFDARATGGLVNRLQLATRVATLVSGQLATAGIGVVTMALFSVVLLWWNPILGLVAVAVASINALVLVVVTRTQLGVNQDLQQSLTALSGYTFTGINMLDDLKATGSENEYFSRWTGIQARVVAAEQRLGILSQGLVVVPGFLTLVNTAVLLALGGHFVLTGTMAVGQLVAFRALAVSFFAPVSQLVSVASQFQNARAWWQQIQDVLDQPLAVDAPTGPPFLALSGTSDRLQPTTRRPPVLPSTGRLRGHMELRGVTFGYSTTQPPLLDGLDLVVRPGERVALVGLSGSGKSTIADLVTGLITPWAGQVLFDGVPRDDIPAEVMAASLAKVDQSILLFSGTAAENISFFDPTLPATDLLRAAQDACIAADLEARTGGFDHLLTEGGRNLSGGQRQRLEIARALANNPSILVLDEATSALDATTESLIDTNLRRRACTCLIVAHRLSTVRDCDQILVLDAGRVVERGTHEQLMVKGGLYEELVTHD